MDSDFQARVDLFIRNTEAAHQSFKWQDPLNKRLSALLYAADNRDYDAAAVEAALNCIKESTRFFSQFRGNTSLSIATMMALAENPELLLQNALDIYDRLKKAGFRSSDYLTIAAVLIAEHAHLNLNDLVKFDPDVVVIRAKAFYDGMHAAHWAITGQDDYIFAAMLALSDLKIEKGLQLIEELYLELKPDFWRKNSFHGLAQVLALAGNVPELPARVESLRQAFREVNLRLDRENTMTTLGVLALLPQKPAEIVAAVQSACEYLRQHKRFGSWSVGKQELLLYAASLFAFESADQINRDVLKSTLTTSVASIIIAQQTAALIAVYTATTVAASASSSAN